MSSTSPGVPGFETIDVLAEGPSSIVRARSLEDGAEVIVKLLDPASEPVLPKRFDRRRRALAKLSDGEQGFSPLLATGVAADGRSYVVLPYYPLGSLQDQLDRGPTPWFPASKLMAKVAEAVGRAHQAEAPLGDIRPSKILLETPDTPVVAVFGMASRRFDDGRPSFRAPESDNDTPPTEPSDVYSLALVLATLIVGRAKERNEPIQSFLTDLVGLAPARIHEVLEHGLTESVMNRYGSGAGMHWALTRAIEEVPDAQSHDADHDTESSDEELDALLHGPLVVSPPDRTEPEPTADGLPPGLDDLVLVGDDGVRTPDNDPVTEDDRLLLPPGLDDIVLAKPGSGHPQDETTPFPFESDPDDTDPGFDDLPAVDAWTTQEVVLDLAEAEPLDPSSAADDAPLDPDEAAIDDGLTIIDLTTAATSGPGEHDTSSHTNGVASEYGTGNGVVELDHDQDPQVDQVDLRHDQDGDGDEPLDDGGDPLGDGGDPGDGEQEIVDLTELFTRTQEFVYDPAIHGSSDQLSEDHQHSGDDPPTVRPPGEPGPAPSVSTTTLVRSTDPVATPAMDHDGVADASGTVLDDVDVDVEAEAPPAEPAPPEMPAPPQMPARAVTAPVDEDPTNLFPDTAEDSPPWVDESSSTGPAPTGPPFLEPDRSEAIPFPNMDRVRNRVDDHRWHARARTAAELLWFRSRRTLGTSLALLGLAVIVAIVVVFAAREIQSATTTVDTEGVPQPLTTATTSPNFVSTDAPFVTDVPPSFQPTTATTARRRAATTTTEATTTAAPTTAAPTTRRTTTTERETTEAPTTRRTTTTERETTEAPTTRRTTTERQTTTERETTTTRRNTTTERNTTEVLPTTDPDDEEDDDDGNNGNNGNNGRGADAAPALSAPTVLTLSQTQASITYSSDTCVATRFQLAGTDGSVQSGNSRGYEASTQCSSAWNLDFSGSSRLRSGVGYTLTVTVKDDDGETASTSVEFTTPS